MGHTLACNDVFISATLLARTVPGITAPLLIAVGAAVLGHGRPDRPTVVLRSRFEVLRGRGDYGLYVRFDPTLNGNGGGVIASTMQPRSCSESK